MSQLIELQDLVVEKIRELSAIATPPAVTVLPERLGELDNRLARNGCALSLMVVVTPAQLYRASTDPAQRRVVARLAIVVLENVLVNRQVAGSKTGPDTVEAIGQGLHNWLISATFGTARTMLTECLSLEYGYAAESLWAIPLSQIRWTAKETECPLTYRVRLETEFDW